MNTFDFKKGWVPEVWVVGNKFVDSFDVVTLEIEPLEKSKKISACPGQFNMVYLFGVGEIPLSFSAIGKTSVRHTIRNVGAVSKGLSNLSVGSQIGVRGPFGRGWDYEIAKGQDIIVVAGGLGLAPLKPLIEKINSHRAEFGKVHVLYGARNPDGILFSSETAHWRKKINVLRSVDTVLGTFSEAIMNPWIEHVGVVLDLLAKVEFNPLHAISFVCGPEVMMRFSLAKLIELGLPKSKVFLSMERNMKCATSHCGRCQYGGHFICKNGPVFCYDEIRNLLTVKEV